MTVNESGCKELAGNIQHFARLLISEADTGNEPVLQDYIRPSYFARKNIHHLTVPQQQVCRFITTRDSNQRLQPGYFSILLLFHRFPQYTLHMADCGIVRHSQLRTRPRICPGLQIPHNPL